MNPLAGEENGDDDWEAGDGGVCVCVCVWVSVCAQPGDGSE
jgi:hypothetical protein